MPLNTAVMFGKATDEWETPQALFDALNTEFCFVGDMAAVAENKKVDFWFGPDSAFGRDALTAKWWPLAGPLWLNPPYSRVREFVAKAVEQVAQGATVVMLIPSRTDTRFWHDHIWDTEKHQPRPGVEIRFIKGRLKFGNSQNSAPFPSVVIIFRPPA